ncbi:recombinase family protein [Chroococcidiopsis sp. CCMEE 29]|uniref:recombinase family protein n=1 Tax=Chroococcidiopsis sp. CCMEE 29 TaxID=155894 RepID=UPI002021DD32|nr:recombinase family protein [Chroococcidiopsis sp. CCMEE 29]
MPFDSVWIIGSSRSGKTARLVDQFCLWVESGRNGQGQLANRRQMQYTQANLPQRLNAQQSEPAVLVLAANDDNRRDLANRMVAATAGKYPIPSKTPLGFFQDEVILFWPLLIQLLNLKAQFPVRLRPETEQELATRLWRSHLNEKILQPVGVNEYRLVRRILDLLQLAAYSGTPIEEISSLLAAFQEEAGEVGGELAPHSSLLLLQWRNWCLERGLLTYGIITELYYQHLLPDPNYRQHLTRRYQFVLADDVDDYPAIARDLFELLLDRGAVGAFTYNPDGAVRLGLGGDPTYLEKLAKRCQVETSTQPPLSSVAETLALPIVELVTDPMVLLTLPEQVKSLQTTSRGELLRETTKLIIKAVQLGQVQPQEIAVIAPGLDAIARYTLVEILTKQGIPVEPLNDQRPLTSSPVIRALLTLLALVYPGLGRVVDRDAVAEMLVVLSRGQGSGVRGQGLEDDSSLLPTPYIDPVRAGLLADHCFEPHPDRPNLLPVTTYDRWDRLGYAATTAYGQILQWLEMQRSQQQQRLLPSPISLLDRAIQRFLWNGSNLPYDQLAALRELLETAQHYWEVDTRLRQSQGIDTPPHATIAEFIQLLRRGTITANPYPVRPIGPASRAVTLATIFQYRSSRRFHRWQFWLDAGSPLWLSGGAATLFGAPLFLQHRFGHPWTAEEARNADEERLRRILRDLLGRVGERVYLCHSDLAVNGQEQMGPLLPLVNASVPLSEPAIT